MYTYVIDSVEHVTASTVRLNLRKNEGERLFSFQPGQYAAISFYRKHRPTVARCFSIMSSPTDPEILQFSMRARGHFTKAAAQLQPGGIVNVRGPFGGFVLDLAHDDDVVLLAGGIGITPFMSMASYASRVRSTNKITLVYSCQNQDDVPFLDELKSLERQNPNFRVAFVIAEGATDKLAGESVAMGRISPEVLEAATAGQYQDKMFYLCGPPPFMQAVIGALRKKGAPEHRILTEAFAQNANRQTGKIRSWPYNIYVLSAVSVVVGSFIVMVGDIFKTLPPSTLFDSSNVSTKTLLANTRQADLDKLVNGLPTVAGGAPESDAVKAANQAANTATTIQVTSPLPTGVNRTPSSTPAATTPAATATPAPTPTPTPAPAPTPPPKKCTTTQSGVTTCV